jgi:hypothetical protein
MGAMKSIAIDLISYEEGVLDERETLELFGTLIRTGMAWTLQGTYGRTANELIHAGYLTQDGNVTEWGTEMLEELTAA